MYCSSSLLTNLLAHILYASSAGKPKKRRIPAILQSLPDMKARKVEPPKRFQVNKKNYPGIDGLRIFHAIDDADMKSIGRSTVTVNRISKGTNIFPAVRWKQPILLNEKIEDHEEKVYAETGGRDALIKVNPYLFIPENFNNDFLIDHAWYLMNQNISATYHIYLQIHGLAELHLLQVT